MYKCTFTVYTGYLQNNCIINAMLKPLIQYIGLRTKHIKHIDALTLVWVPLIIEHF